MKRIAPIVPDLIPLRQEQAVIPAERRTIVRRLQSPQTLLLLRLQPHNHLQRLKSVVKNRNGRNSLDRKRRNVQPVPQDGHDGVQSALHRRQVALPNQPPLPTHAQNVHIRNRAQKKVQFRNPGSRQKQTNALPLYDFRVSQQSLVAAHYNGNRPRSEGLVDSRLEERGGHEIRGARGEYQSESGVFEDRSSGAVGAAQCPVLRAGVQVVVAGQVALELEVELVVRAEFGHAFQVVDDEAVDLGVAGVGVVGSVVHRERVRGELVLDLALEREQVLSSRW